MPDPAKSDGADVPDKLNFDWRAELVWQVPILYTRCGFAIIQFVSCGVISRQLHQVNEQEVGWYKHISTPTRLGLDTKQSFEQPRATGARCWTRVRTWYDTLRDKYGCVLTGYK